MRVFIESYFYRIFMERTVLLIQNFSWIQIRKVILLNHQNNYVETLKLEHQNALLIIFEVPTKLFSNLCSAKF